MSALGIGASSAATVEELETLVGEVLGAADVRDVRVVGTVEHCADVVGELCARRGWELRTFTADELSGVDVPHPSDRVAELAGTPSVAEAAALRLGAELVVGKTASAHATVAVAR